MTRQITRRAGLLALALVAITCTDAPTGPSSSSGRSLNSGRMAFAPSFSADAARAFVGLRDFGLDVTNARVRLTDSDGRQAKDTVISFPVTQDTLQVDLSVQMQGSEQSFTALIELRNANGVVLFSGTRLVTARAGGIPSAASLPFQLEYAGPGRTARTMRVSPSDVTTSAAAVVPVAAFALDAAGVAVPDLLVRWTSSDQTLATVTSTGNAAAEMRGAGKRGTVTIGAISPTGLSASTRVSLVPAATRVIVISGASQTGVAGRALGAPFVVELQAGDGGPVPNAPIAFRAVTAGGIVALSTVTTDAAGRASTPVTLGRSAGVYTFEATSGALAPASITATATAAPAAALTLVSGDAQSDSIGKPLAQPFVVKVIDEFGGPVSGAAVDWTRVTGAGVLAAARTVSGSDGLASVAYTLGFSTGAERVLASLAGVVGASVVFNAVATPRGPRSIVFVVASDRTGTVGTTLPTPLVVFVADTLGNPVQGAMVAFTAQGPAGTVFSPAATTTDASGLAQTIVTLSPTAGTTTVTATVGTLGATVRVIAKAGSAKSFVLLQPLPSTLAVGVPPAAALRVQIADASGNAVALSGIEVTATGVVTPGSAPPLSIVATSDGAGVVTFNLPAYVGAIGTATITLTSPGMTTFVAPPLTFVTGPVAKLRIVTQPPVIAPISVPFAVQPVVELGDAGSNSVKTAGVLVTASVASGTGVLGGTTTVATDASGVATFTDLSISGSAGLHTIGFSSPSLVTAVSSQVDITAAVSAAAIEAVAGFLPPPTASSSVVLNGFKVRLVDNAQQPVARANVPIIVRATAFGTTAPNVPLTGTITRLTDAAGTALFDDVAFNAPAGNYTLTARADSVVIALPVLTLVNSLALSTGPAATIVVSKGARTLAASGATIGAGAVTFQVKDALGSTSPSRGYTVNLTTSGNCSIQTAFRTVSTNATSAASVPIDMGAGVGGCIVSATTAGVATPARVQLVAPPSNTTHVWFGANGGGPSAWEGGGGWLPVPPMTPGSWPSSQSSDDAYVPFWFGQYTTPQLTMVRAPALGPLAIRRLQIDSLAAVDLGGKAIIVAGDSAGGLRSLQANGAQMMNGRVLIYGAGALVTGGVFDRMSIGDTLTATTNFCASNSIAARLRNVVVLNALDVHCKLVVDSAVTAGAVNTFSDPAQSGWMLLASPTAMLSTASGNFAGDSVVMTAGAMSVTVGATFAGRLAMSAGTSLQVTGDANFIGGGTLANAQISIGRNATFGGFASSGYSFIGGGLQVLGNLTQIVSSIPNVFVASSDHLTRFAGSTLQQVSFANPTVSGFSQLELVNAGAGVELNSAVNVGAGTANPRVALLGNAKLFVRSGMSLGVQGNLVLGSSSVLDIAGGANVSVTGACSGRTTNAASVTGSGTVNGSAITTATCTP